MDKGKLLVVGVIWTAICLVVFGGYKLVLAPMFAEKKAEQQEQQHKQTIETTGSSSRYKSNVRIATDSFSGYAVLRSAAFQQYCGDKGIRLELVDIPDYDQRLSDLQSGGIQMAAFSVDALVKTSASLKDLPATIVAVIDESSGADAMLTSKRFASLDALNDPSTKFVLVGDSPSETFVHVVRRSFDLDKLGLDPFVRVGSAKDVVQAYRQSKPTDKNIFVTWQPEVSQITANADYKVLLDSSRLRGYIVDVLVVSRDFLSKDEAAVVDVVKSYLQANFDSLDKPALVAADASLPKDQGKIVADGILWRNTQENYAHFGLSRQPGYLHLEDIINNVTKVLIGAKALNADPTNGQPNLLYYDRIMRSLLESNFHPGSSAEKVQAESHVAALTDEQWKSLVPVGTMQVPQINFARGTAKLNASAEEVLVGLTEQLKTWSQYYVVVRGHAKGTSPADLEAQKKRADAVVTWLVNHGVSRNRIRAESSESNGSSTVKFRFGQLPY